MECPWCSNPEGLNPAPQIMTFDQKCIGCQSCAAACPPGAIRFDNDKRIIDWALCDQCLECAGPCPSGAIEIAGVHKTVDEVFETAARDEAFYRTSGGGVTVSGGEPLLQWEFVRALFQKCKKAGTHTALDTSGHCKWEHMEAVLEHTDLVLFDIKHMDPEPHREKTGLTNDLILANLEKTAPRTKIWLRIPLTPGFNDSAANMKRTAELASRINAEKISLLPHHDWGKEKYARLGKAYPFHGVESLKEDSETVTRCREILESYNLKIETGV